MLVAKLSEQVSEQDINSASTSSPDNKAEVEQEKTVTPNFRGRGIARKPSTSNNKDQYSQMALNTTVQALASKRGEQK